MRSTHLYPGRPEYYDRNPEIMGQDWQATGVGPHAPTERFSFTVPDKRKLIITSAYGRILRGTVPTTPYIAKLYIGIEDPMVGIKDAFWVEHYSTTVGDLKSEHAELNLVVPPGWIVHGYSMDSSTGGTCAYRLHWVGVTFDA